MECVIFLKFFLLIIIGLIMGFLSSIPVGGVQLEVAKKAINGHLAPAIAIAIGSATSDFIYGVLTIYGLGGFLFHKEFRIGLYILGIVVLLFLFFRSLNEYRSGAVHYEKRLVYKKRMSFFTGFTIAITNPGMIIWWIIGFKIFLDFNLFETITPLIKMIFIVSGCIGLSGYLIFIATILNKMQQSVSKKFLKRMNICLLVLLGILITYFIVKLISLIFNYHTVLP
ncbi:MAG: LysE family transporter [Spirochaetes bacterium]|nr:LysE family transporter [Spirochaetota bacterium]